MPCKFSNPVKAEVFSDFESFSRFPEWSWVNNMPRVPGGTESETVEAGLGPVSAWLGREPAL